MAMNITGTGTGNEKAVDALNSLLRGELSAVETYRQAIERLDDPALRTQLEQQQADHRQRVTRLQQLVLQLGGKPSESSGPWGALTKLIEGSATAFGDKTAIAALEEGEDIGLRDYRKKVDDLDASSAQIVRSELLPAQERTHAALSALKKSLALH
jgi:uncharacterized protein (TIGR02284 family)